MSNKMEKCYSIVDIEARPGGIWGLRPLDMAEVVVTVIFLIGNSVFKNCLHFETKHATSAKSRLLSVSWLHWEIGLLSRKEINYSHIRLSLGALESPDKNMVFSVITFTFIYAFFYCSWFFNSNFSSFFLKIFDFLSVFTFYDVQKILGWDFLNMWRKFS